MLAEALICYDANVLLNVYRYSDDTQKALIEVFKAHVDRTHLPYQVALEYARNRPKTIVDQVESCKATNKAFEKVINEHIKPQRRQPFLSDKSMEALEAIKNELERKREALEAMILEDQYADLLVSLFEQKIGPFPDETTLENLNEQAKERYDKKIPPGYSDLKDKDTSRSYGDYIVWRQLMDIAKEEKKNFIFVTDDSKEDWWLRLSGKIIGPQPPLLEEFYRETGQRVWLFSSESFLIATNKAGSAKVADSVIKEVSAHYVAQNSGLKLSDLEDANGSASDVKLSSPQIKAVEFEAPAQYSKVKAPEEEIKARTDKKMGTDNEDDGGEE